MFSRKAAAIADKAILYDPPGIGCKATARWVEGQCCIAEPDTALLIQVLIAKTSNADHESRLPGAAWQESHSRGNGYELVS